MANYIIILYVLFFFFQIKPHRCQLWATLQAYEGLSKIMSLTDKKGVKYVHFCVYSSAVSSECIITWWHLLPCKGDTECFREKSPVLMNILLPFTGEGSACYRFNVDMNAGIHPKRDIRGDINQGACRNTVSCLLWSVLCGKSLLGVNTSELLNRPSNYRIVNQQTEGVLEGNSCCLRGGKCVCG